MEMQRLPFGQSHADKIRAAHYRWVNMPPGIPPDMANDFMAKLKAGSTIPKLTGGGKRSGPHIVSLGRFKKHCKLNPIWGAEALRISDANGRLLKGARVRSFTHCKHGHPLSGDNLYIAPGRNERKCLTCVKRRYDAPVPATPEQIQQLTAALNSGKTISQICWGKRDGRITEIPILSFRKLKLYRRQNPDFEAFLKSATADNNLKGQRRRYQPDRVRIEVVRSQNNDFKAIIDLTPAYLPPDVRNDIAQSIFLALFEGSLRRDQIKARVQRFVTDQNRMFPTKFAKFGDSPLVSLDEVLFDDGTRTRGENVSSGLWD